MNRASTGLDEATPAGVSLPLAVPGHTVSKQRHTQANFSTNESDELAVCSHPDNFIRPSRVELQWIWQYRKFAGRVAALCERWHRTTRVVASNFTCNAYRDTIQFGMIKSFVHKGLAAFFVSGSKAGIQVIHAKRLRLQLAKLDSASVPTDMDLPGWKLHSLKGDMKGHWSVWVDQSWSEVKT